MTIFRPFGSYLDPGSPRLPLREACRAGQQKLSAAILEARGHRELGEAALPYAARAIEEFRDASRAGDVEP